MSIDFQQLKFKEFYGVTPDDFSQLKTPTESQIPSIDELEENAKSESVVDFTEDKEEIEEVIETDENDDEEDSIMEFPLGDDEDDEN